MSSALAPAGRDWAQPEVPAGVLALLDEADARLGDDRADRGGELTAGTVRAVDDPRVCTRPWFSFMDTTYTHLVLRSIGRSAGAD